MCVTLKGDCITIKTTFQVYAVENLDLQIFICFTCNIFNRCFVLWHNIFEEFSIFS